MPNVPLQSDGFPKGRSWVVSLLRGVAVSALFGAAVGVGVYTNWVLLHGDPGFELTAVKAAFFGAFVIFFGAGLTGAARLNRGHRGVPRLSKSRRTTYLLDEGFHWMIPGVEDVIPVDCRPQTRTCRISPDDDEKALSKDKVIMDVGFFWTYQIINPYLYESIRGPLGIVDGRARGLTRSTVASSDWEVLIQADTKSKASARVFDDVCPIALAYGIKATGVTITSVLPPDEIINANKAKAEEQAGREAEAVRFANIKDRINDLKSTGLSPMDAYLVHGAETKSVPVERKLGEFGLSGPTTNLIEKGFEILGQAIGKAIAGRNQGSSS